jgi:hypothetical protein
MHFWAGAQTAPAFLAGESHPLPHTIQDLATFEDEPFSMEKSSGM